MAWRYVVQAVCPAVRSFVRCMASFLALRPLELRMLRTVLKIKIDKRVGTRMVAVAAVPGRSAQWGAGGAATSASGATRA